MIIEIENKCVVFIRGRRAVVFDAREYRKGYGRVFIGTFSVRGSKASDARCIEHVRNVCEVAP